MKKKLKNKISLSEYWERIELELDERFKRAKNYIDHSISNFSVENYIRDIFQQYLPTRYIIDCGFAVNSSGDRSDLIDIIIADSFHIPPLCSEPNYKVFAIESVCAAVEITTAPNGYITKKKKKIPKFESDIRKLAKIRNMGRSNTYLHTIPVSTENRMMFKQYEIKPDVCPRAFMVTCGKEWAHRATYQKNLEKSLFKVREETEDTWMNAILSFKHGMLHFPPDIHSPRNWREQNSLLEFILFLNDAISSYQTFQIDIRRYRNTIPEL